MRAARRQLGLLYSLIFVLRALAGGQELLTLRCGSARHLVVGSSALVRILRRHLHEDVSKYQSTE